MSDEMRKMIAAGMAFDLSDAPRDGKYYVVENFDPDMDYCILSANEWVKSVGRRKADGMILAALDGMNEKGFTIIWYR